MSTRGTWVFIATLAMVAGAGARAASAPADWVVTDARIYTADSKRSLAEALAVSADKVVFVGSAAEAQKWIGPNTKTQRLGGKLVLPGLIDAHMHPLGIADVDRCDLASDAKSLRD